MKTFTVSTAKSIQCKIAVQEVLRNSEPSSEDLGAALRSVLQYREIRGQFSSIHPDLGAVGVTGVEVTDQGIRFVRNTTPGNIIQSVIQLAN